MMFPNYKTMILHASKIEFIIIQYIRNYDVSKLLKNGNFLLMDIYRKMRANKVTD